MLFVVFVCQSNLWSVNCQHKHISNLCKYLWKLWARLLYRSEFRYLMISHRIFDIEVAFKIVCYIWALLPGSKFIYAFQLHSCIAETRKLKIFLILGELPSGLMFRILGFLCQDPGSIRGQGTKIVQATWCGQKKFPISV